VKDNIHPLVQELFILCTVQEMKIEVGSHYCVCSWLMILTLNLPMTTIVAQPFNVVKWQLKFNPVA
jgi:hypothetical protein